MNDADRKTLDDHPCWYVADKAAWDRVKNQYDTLLAACEVAAEDKSICRFCYRKLRDAIDLAKGAKP